MYSGEAGSVLVLTLFLTLVILGIGLMAMWMATSTTKVYGNLLRRQEAMQAARAGLAQARVILLGLGGSGGVSAPNFSPALRGDYCMTPPTDDTARLAAIIPGRGRVLCSGTMASIPGGPLENISVIDSASMTASVAVTNSDYPRKVTYTAYVRNDEDEYRWCDAHSDHGEGGADSGDCNQDGTKNDLADKVIRNLRDDDSRIILRVEARGRGGLSFAAVEAVISGRIPIVIRNSYSQLGGSGGQNANNVVLQ